MRSWVWYAVGAVAGAAGIAGLAVLARRRGDGGLHGIWSSDTTKLASIYPDELTIIWKLPPGPVPQVRPADRRRAYQELCSRVSPREEWRGRGPQAWMRPMVPTGKRWTRRFGKEPWRKPENQPLPWWTEGGTCPGCSQVCGVSCYAGRAQNYYDWVVRRVPYANLCDLMAGKGIPRIREDLTGELGRKRQLSGSEAVLTPQSWRPTHGPAARPAPPPQADYWTNEVVVNPRKIRRVYIRVHETGDFFDAAYARQWLAEAKRYVTEYYPRELRRFQAGQRDVPPPRIYWWAYTRSWRDEGIRPVLREFSRLRYPAFCWSREGRIPVVHESVAEAARRRRARKGEIVPAKKRRWRQVWEAGQKCEREQDAFAVLLSADADTGVPWMRDARRRIMPVAYLATAYDKLHLPQLLNKVPGVVFQDYELRTQVSPEVLFQGSRICRAEFRTPKWQQEIDEVVRRHGLPSEDEARATLGEKAGDKPQHPRAKRELEAIDKQHKLGCGVCGYCRPNNIQAIADASWNRFIAAARVGADESVRAELELGRRSDRLTDYERFMDSGLDYAVAVEPVEDLQRRIEQTKEADWTKQRLLALSRSALYRKAAHMPTVGTRRDLDEGIRGRAVATERR